MKESVDVASFTSLLQVGDRGYQESIARAKEQEAQDEARGEGRRKSV